MNPMKSRMALLVISLFPLSSLAEDNELDCLLEPNKHIEVSSPVRGIISHLYVSRGDVVSSGDRLFDLRSEQEKAEVKVAEAKAEFGKRTLLRNDDLYEQDLISIHERDQYETDAKLAQLALEEARVRLALKQVVSPISGYVVETGKAEGEYVDEQPLVTLVNIDPLFVEVVAPSSYLGRVQKGMQAKVIPEAPMNSPHPARVSIVDPIVDAASGTIRIRLEMANPGGKIPSGLRCGLEFAK